MLGRPPSRVEISPAQEEELLRLAAAIARRESASAPTSPSSEVSSADMDLE